MCNELTKVKDFRKVPHAVGLSTISFVLSRFETLNFPLFPSVSNAIHIKIDQYNSGLKFKFEHLLDRIIFSFFLCQKK